MTPVLRLDELRAVEGAFAGRGISLMARAGEALAAEAARLARDGGPVLVVAGGGNNGGDAWVAAARLLERFHKVVVLDVAGEPPRLDEAKRARERVVAGGGAIVREWPAAIRPSLVVDGLFGIGLARDVDAAAGALIDRMNACGAPILAVDVPSGLDAGSGRIRGRAVRATRTLTFIAHKPGLHTLDGPDRCGDVVLDDLGTGDAVREAATGELLAPATVAPWLAPRERNSHKGTFGTLGIVGGNRGMVGAALLAGRAALLCGAGKVRVGLLAGDAISLDPLHPELMFGLVEDAMRADVVVAGPGAGLSPSATSVSMFDRNLMPAILGLKAPLVLDADALNAIATHEGLQAALLTRSHPSVITPHPAEAGRLLHRESATVQSDRVGTALELASRLNTHVVLKGAGSVVASPDGRWAINTTGNPGLASGGTGDVLAGIVGAMLAQGLPADRALAYAVCLHGAAADALVARGVGPVGMTASEVALAAREVLNRWVSSRG